jgi:hypothetical protein
LNQCGIFAGSSGILGAILLILFTLTTDPTGLKVTLTELEQLFIQVLIMAKVLFDLGLRQFNLGFIATNAPDNSKAKSYHYENEDISQKENK